MRNSGLMSFFVKGDIFISVCDVDQSAASSPLTPNAVVTQAVHVACIFNVVEMGSYIFICFYIGFTRIKNFYNAVLRSIRM